jgi:hypothetical protein
MKIWQLVFIRENNVVVETYKEGIYALEQYNKLVEIWKNKPQECEFIKEEHDREFGYYRTTHFTNNIRIELYGDVLREIKNKIG